MTSVQSFHCLDAIWQVTSSLLSSSFCFRCRTTVELVLCSVLCSFYWKDFAVKGSLRWGSELHYPFTSLSFPLMGSEVTGCSSNLNTLDANAWWQTTDLSDNAYITNQTTDIKESWQTDKACPAIISMPSGTLCIVGRLECLCASLQVRQHWVGRPKSFALA